MFELSDFVAVGEAMCRIRSDFRVVLEIFVMLQDPELDDGDRTEALTRMFYVDRPADTEAAVKAFASFVDLRPRSDRKRPGLVDWEADFDLIAAAVNHVLGTECRTLPHLHWRTFLGAYMEISHDSLFSRVISIREKTKTGRKLEKWEREWYRKNKDLVDLPMKYSESEKALLEEWT